MKKAVFVGLALGIACCILLYFNNFGKGTPLLILAFGYLAYLIVTVNTRERYPSFLVVLEHSNIHLL